MSDHRVYLDNNATTPVDKRAVAVMVEELQGEASNPSSVHAYGQRARNTLTKVRRQISSFLGCKPQELVFVASGTEAVNLLIRGTMARHTTGHIVTTSVEHAAVYNTVLDLEERGYRATYLSPGTAGAVTAEAVANAIQPDTRLIAVMAVNNETGVKTDIAAIAAVAAERKLPFVVDAVAWLGKDQIEIPRGVTGMAFSAHKVHGPKGVGLAFIRTGAKIHPEITGGGQENGKRSGTENLAGIIGFGVALEILQEEIGAAIPRMERLRDHLEERLIESLPGVLVNGSGPRVCNVSNLSFSEVEGESLLLNLDMAGVAVSHGAACSSGALEPSRVLLNMGFSKARAGASIRFSLSRLTTLQDIETCIAHVIDIVTRLRRC